MRVIPILALGGAASATALALASLAGGPVEAGQAAPAVAVYSAVDSWWTPGRGTVLPAVSEYENEHGRVRVLNTAGAIATRNHAFFSPLSDNGRACVTCHQPADGMGLSVKTIRSRWDATNGRDPMFAAVDGSNCPHLPQDRRESHSLLLERGLFRMALQWPPRRTGGGTLEPEFSIEVVRDPTGCNTHPVHGLNSPQPKVSVYRRPRPLANMKYLTELPKGVPPHDVFFYNDKTLLPKDPETGKFVSLQLMADGRLPTLGAQARDASSIHLEFRDDLSRAQLQQIIDFEQQIYVAQGVHRVGGALTGPGAPPGLGPEVLARGAPARLGNNPINRIFGSFAMWRNPPVPPRETTQEKARREFRQSVARGAEVFHARRFFIRDVGAYNDKGLGNPFKRSCGSGCHNTLLMGMDLAPGFMDLGLNNYPWNDRPDLPLFKVTCKADAPPQSYLGRVIYTHDPGRSLITGKCRDVGATITQQMRGLSARAPYFANGSARDLRELVDFYDRRFNIGYTEQEKQDLVNFMSVL